MCNSKIYVYARLAQRALDLTLAIVKRKIS